MGENKTLIKNQNETEIIIPEGITHLDYETLKKYKNAKKIVLPNSLVSLGPNTFKDFKYLEEISLPPNIKELPNSTFENCFNLKKINYSGSNKLKIGKRCFRNCHRLEEVPTFIENYNKRAFENCHSITTLNIIDKNIPHACFRGCISLKEITNQHKIMNMESFAFSGCESLEEINIYNLQEVPAEAFSNCKKLKKVELNERINCINARAFFNCLSLTDINLPDLIKFIRKEAFKNCHSIKHITIPANLSQIGDAALSYMDSLESIDVSPYNHNFITPDHKILINELQQKLVLYASGCKNKHYSLKNYVVNIEMFNREIIQPITCIGEYAFAGSKNLEELTLCGLTKDIESTSFADCPNLKKLNVEAISFGTCPGFNIREHGRYYFDKSAKTKIDIPFEEVEFIGDLVQIFPNALQHFYNVKKLKLPTDHDYSISTGAFTDCNLLREVNIPNQVKSITKNSFSPNTKLIFENGLKITGLQELSHSNDHIGPHKLYTTYDGTYYIEQNDQITTLTKEQIRTLCTNPEVIENNPVLYLDFMNFLFSNELGLKELFNGILISNLSLENREILLKNLNKEDKYFLKVLETSDLLKENDEDTKSLLGTDEFNKVIAYINLLKKYKITNPLLFSKYLMKYYPIEEFEKLIKTDLPLLEKVLEESKLFEPDKTKKTKYKTHTLTYQALKRDALSNFINLIKKYKVTDKFLYDKAFIAFSNNSYLERISKIYDANIKRMLKASKVLDDNNSALQNLNDLAILMDITGALEEDEITRQRASTFLTEKIFTDNLPDNTNNPYKITGDDIHRIFNFPYIRKEFDLEFANFFIENYQELIEEEKNKSGFIQRVYLNFRDISKTCTSHKGSQRKLKVTIDKCKSYLSTIKFDGVTKENKDFADLISAWYDKNETWLNAQRIYEESLSAPRNIFTKIKYDKYNEPIYDNDKEKDLREEINPNYSYEWLPKQDYHNLILGKYCSCCAHIEGAGQGIMRASMILDNCQNLVIRDEKGNIIAKSTLYVNRDKGYAVFNNVETSLSYRQPENIEKIYNAFLRGTKAFIKTYNKNNKENPITDITIGTNRNTILTHLTNEHHPVVNIKQSLKYGNYSLNGSGYYGDWSSGQRLVLKR